MLKRGSKMRPPFFDDFWSGYGGIGGPTRESKASQDKDQISGPEPCLLKNTPVPPLTGGGGSLLACTTTADPFGLDVIKS